MCFVVFSHRLIKKTRHSAGARSINMKTLMILTAALATAFVSGFFTAPTANAGDVCAEVSFCTVFTTRTFHQGNLNGLAGADAICNARAAEASLPGIYMAWLADQTGSPSTRFVQSTVPYVLTDGNTVANSYIDLVTDGTLLIAIDLDEFGDAVTGGQAALNWTNVLTAGNVSEIDQSLNCIEWTATGDTSGPKARFGENTSTTARWTGIPNTFALCRLQLHLYCFEQPQPNIIRQGIPTLSNWGMITTAGVLGLLAVIGLFVMRRKKATA